jgi:hypothetical protein
MLRAVLSTVTVLGLALLPYPGQAASITTLKSLKLDVPTSDTMFPAGPGSDAINNNCLACHSADHVLNQPSLSRAAWQEVVNKMITAYKAPVSPDDAKASWTIWSAPKALRRSGNAKLAAIAFSRRKLQRNEISPP